MSSIYSGRSRGVPAVLTEIDHGRHYYAHTRRDAEPKATYTLADTGERLADAVALQLMRQEQEHHTRTRRSSSRSSVRSVGSRRSSVSSCAPARPRDLSDVQDKNGMAAVLGPPTPARKIISRAPSYSSLLSTKSDFLKEFGSGSRVNVVGGMPAADTDLGEEHTNHRNLDFIITDPGFDHQEDRSLSRGGVDEVVDGNSNSSSRDQSFTGEQESSLLSDFGEFARRRVAEATATVEPAASYTGWTDTSNNSVSGRNLHNSGSSGMASMPVPVPASPKYDRNSSFSSQHSSVAPPSPRFVQDFLPPRQSDFVIPDPEIASSRSPFPTATSRSSTGVIPPTRQLPPTPMASPLRSTQSVSGDRGGRVQTPLTPLGQARMHAFSLPLLNHRPESVHRRRARGYLPCTRRVDVIEEEDRIHAVEYDRIGDLDEDVSISTANPLEPTPAVFHQPSHNWEDLGLYRELIEKLEFCYYRPRKIQKFAIPAILTGRDVIIHSETGTGKTMAFILPLLTILTRKLRADPNWQPDFGHPYALIIVPTHELATQHFEYLGKFLYGSEGPMISYVRLMGEQAMNASIAEANGQNHIVVGTIGRICDLVERGFLHLGDVKFFVIDEADMVFRDRDRDLTKFPYDIRNVLDALPKKELRQNVFIGATVGQMFFHNTDAYRYANNNYIVGYNKTRKMNANITVRFVKVAMGRDPKNWLYRYLLQNCRQESGYFKAYIFVQTIAFSRDLTAFLQCKGLRYCYDFNSDLGQEDRDRIIANFRSCKNGHYVIVSTNVTGRGVHVSDVDDVVLFDVIDKDSFSAKDFVHQCGRVGRLRQGRAHVVIRSETSENVFDSLRVLARDNGAKVEHYDDASGVSSVEVDESMNESF